VHDSLGHAVPGQVGEPLAYVDVREGDALVQLDRLDAAAPVHVATIVEGATGVDRCSRARCRHLLSRGGDGRCVPMFRRWLLTAGSSRFSGVRCAVLVLRLVRVGVVRPRALFGQA
jgi:hypothetical protein